MIVCLFISYLSNSICSKISKNFFKFLIIRLPRIQFKVIRIKKRLNWYGSLWLPLFKRSSYIGLVFKTKWKL